MNLQRNQFVRSDRWDLEGFSSKEKLFDSVKGILKTAYEKIITIEYRRKIFLIICVIILGVDPLFLFVPEIDAQRFCLTFYKTLAVSVCVIRTLIDTFYFFYFIYHESVVHSDSKFLKKIRHLFHVIFHIFSILPFPQVLILGLIYWYQWLVIMRYTKWIILAQYITRIIRMYPLYKRVTWASGRVAETKWIGAGLNLYLYILHSYVFGAFWYANAVEMQYYCWRQVCAKTFKCNVRNLHCGHRSNNSHFLNTSCPLTEPEQITNPTVFNFGIYIDALKSGIAEVEPRDFLKRIVYCFWWGLQNMSAFGQNLKTSYSVKDVFFAIIICVSGLLLFGVLIGNVQKYLQSNTIRADEMEEKKRDREKWMYHWKLPRDLKARIRKHEDKKWRETRGLEDDSYLLSLPEDIRLETKCHMKKNMSRLETKRFFYKNRLKGVPWLNIMDDGWLLEALCARMEYVMYPAKSYIVREGDSVENMLIVTKGSLKSMSASSDYHDLCYLQAGDICGDLLFWVLDHPSSPPPTSNKTILALTDVEGFILLPDDLKFVASHFTRFHSKNIKHMFRFYSLHWRSWAACFIQATWRNYSKKKVSTSLHAKSDYQQIPQGTKQNVKATLYVSKVFLNLREEIADCSSSTRMPPPIPQKPADPEFSKNET